MNPFDLRGPEFLVFYLIFSAIVIVGLVIFRRISESGSAPRMDLGDPYLIAYLRGGDSEALRVALVSLIDRGLLNVTGKQIQRAKTARPESVRRPIEKALLETYSRPGEATEIFKDQKLNRTGDEYKETLERNRLVPDEQASQARLVRFLVAFFVLGGVAGVKILIALERGRTNIGFLVVLTIVAIVVAGKVSFPRLTELGKSVLADAQSLYSGLKDRASLIRPGGATIEPVMLAAAFGVGALAGDGFAYTKTLFPRAQSSSFVSSCGSSCSSSCGSSCGGGGCGGGCGGCGS